MEHGSGTSCGHMTHPDVPRIATNTLLDTVEIRSDMMETQSLDQDSCGYDSSFNERRPPSSNTSSIPPRGSEIDRWHRHISMRDFANEVQKAAKSVYPNENRSRYSKVYVLILKWKTEDPDLPVSYEIEELRKVLDEIYHYHIETFEIPDQKSHAVVSKKINAFVDINGDSKSDLKIVYYAGHSRLSKTRDLVLSSWQNKKKPKCSTVTWTGIQHALEQAESDVLILLDSCSSGLADAGEGNGVTELMSACAFDVEANGVGHYSFTKALTIELRLLSKKRSFPVVDLYTNVYCRAQHHMAQGLKNERYPAPIHLLLTRDDHFPRSIQLSIQEPLSDQTLDRSKELAHQDHSVEPTNSNRKRPLEDESKSLSKKHRHQRSNYQSPQAEPIASTPVFSNMPQVEPAPLTSNAPEALIQEQVTEGVLPEAFSSQAIEDYAATSLDKCGPRLLFSIRLEDNIRAEDLSSEYFTDWLRAIPAIAKEVTVEGAFKCDSTIIILALPFCLWPYLSSHPAVVALGLVKSSNLLLDTARANTQEEAGTDIMDMKDHYSTTAQWESQPNSSFLATSSQPAVSPMQDPYGTLLQDDCRHQEYNTQTYNQADHRQLSPDAELPRLQKSLSHTDSTNLFHTDSPPWAPEVGITSSDSHQRGIPNIPGFDNYQSYHPPYVDKLQGDLRLMAQEHSHVQGYQDDQEYGFVHEDLDDEEREAEDEKERKNKRSKGKEKRKASLPPTQKRNKRERRDRGGGSGNRRGQAGRA